MVEVLICLVFVWMVAISIRTIDGYISALHHIRCYNGDEPDAKEHAEVAYYALHPMERRP